MNQSIEGGFNECPLEKMLPLRVVSDTAIDPPHHCRLTPVLSDETVRSEQ
jgi:hypothetical protein